MNDHPQRIGLLGGSFDPVHYGHLSIAREALEHAQLHYVYFIPATQNPHKIKKPYAADHHRLSMLELCLKEEPLFHILTDELHAGGQSYTFHTLERLRQRYPHAHFFWIMGADQLPDLHRWHRIEDLAKLTTFLVMRRKGTLNEAKTLFIEGLNIDYVPSAIVPVSATTIRGQLAKGETAATLLPPQVYTYIKTHALYKRE